MTRFFPLFRQNAPTVVVVDPRRAFGRPVLEGTSVLISTLRGRWRAGESVSELAEDYGLAPVLVEEALRAATAA